MLHFFTNAPILAAYFPQTGQPWVHFKREYASAHPCACYRRGFKLWQRARAQPQQISPPYRKSAHARSRRPGHPSGQSLTTAAWPERLGARITLSIHGCLLPKRNIGTGCSHRDWQMRQPCSHTTTSPMDRDHNLLVGGGVAPIFLDDDQLPFLGGCKQDRGVGPREHLDHASDFAARGNVVIGRRHSEALYHDMKGRNIFDVESRRRMRWRSSTKTTSGTE